MVDTVFYNEMAATALDLITQFGRTDLTLTRQIGTTYDPAEDIEVPGTDLTQSIKCLVLPIGSGLRNTIDPSDNLQEQSLIAESMREMKVAASGLTFTPAAGDQVTLEGSRWVALGVTPISPAGIPLLYVIPIKKG